MITGLGQQRGSPARTVKIGANPRMIVVQQLLQAANPNLMVDQNSDAITD